MKKLQRDRKHLKIFSESSTLQDHTQRVLQEERKKIILELEIFKIIRDLTSRDQMIKIDRVDKSIKENVIDSVDSVDLSICYK